MLGVIVGWALPTVCRRVGERAKSWAMPTLRGRQLIPCSVVPLLLCSLVFAQTSGGITITGGPDGSGQNYEWTVTNNSPSPIIDISFPHHHADTFISPGDHTPASDLDDWTEECSHLQVAGATQSNGICRAFVTDPDRGILPGRNAKFGVRIARIGAEKGPGNVTVKLGDGTTVTVAGVMLPVAPSVGQKYGMTIFMGGGLAVFIAIQVARRRRAREAAARAAAGEAGNAA